VAVERASHEEKRNKEKGSSPGILMSLLEEDSSSRERCEISSHEKEKSRKHLRMEYDESDGPVTIIKHLRRRDKFEREGKCLERADRETFRDCSESAKRTKEPGRTPSDRLFSPGGFEETAQPLRGGKI